MEFTDYIARYGILGAAAGVFFELVFWIIGILKLNLFIGIPFATVTVGRTGLAAEVGKSILGPLVGKIPDMGMLNSFVMAALFGAVFVAVGGLVYEYLLKGVMENIEALKAKKRTMKLMYVIVIASIFGGIIIHRALALPTVMGFIAILVNSAFVAWILGKIEPIAKYIP